MMKNVKVNYKGSLFWLFFWVIIFFPVALTLLFSASTFVFDKTTYIFKYNGSRFWLCFWVIFFFPIAFVLIFLKGFSVEVKKAKKAKKKVPQEETKLL